MRANLGVFITQDLDIYPPDFGRINVKPAALAQGSGLVRGNKSNSESRFHQETLNPEPVNPYHFFYILSKFWRNVATSRPSS